MQTPDSIGAELTPDEASYFESGGATEIPRGDAVADEGNDAAPRPEAAPAGGDGKPERMVALAALHEERSRRREIDRQYRETQQQLAELRGKFAVIERLNTPQPEPPPSVEEDIYGAVRATTEAVDDLRQRMAARDARDRAARQEQDVIAAYRTDAAQFEARMPDFREAYGHLLASRAQELAALGYDDPRAIHDALMADEFAVAQAALARRQSPAEIIYNLARQRGYVGSAANAARGRAGERLASIERGQAANKSLSATGGASGDADISAEALLKMPMDEFEAWCAKNPARARRLMGG
ncbi:MAG: hypothetical protein P4M07_28240 [Xanthobacteraceae bacterium]|nr:hypothetical protein [Xanthobacteraceae bacterium]